jgi:transposase
VALLSGRYRLSRREVRQLLHDLWQVRLSLGAVVRQEQAQSAALAPIVEEARAAVQQAPVVNMDETGWRQEQRRAWLWTVVTAELAVFWIDRSRGGAVVDALLGAAFAGVVGSDRWAAYSRFPAEQASSRRTMWRSGRCVPPCCGARAASGRTAPPAAGSRSAC